MTIYILLEDDGPEGFSHPKFVSTDKDEALSVAKEMSKGDVWSNYILFRAVPGQQYKFHEFDTYEAEFHDGERLDT